MGLEFATEQDHESPNLRTGGKPFLLHPVLAGSLPLGQEADRPRRGHRSEPLSKKDQHLSAD